MKLKNAIRIHAALAAARDDHRNAIDAAAEIKAARRKGKIACLRARGRRLYAAWLDPRNPGWHPPQEKPANVVSIADVQFPRGLNTRRTAEILGSIHFMPKGGAA